jgi:acyl-ACP thioesterase
VSQPVLPLPEKGRVFEHQRITGPADVDGAGLLHLHSVAGWLQDAAFADVLDAGLVESRAWVVRRTLLRVERPPAFAEKLRVRTFCAGLAKSVAERRTSIEGDSGARIEAEAIWVQVDPETRMPTRFSDRFIAIYAESAAGRRARSSLRHPPPPAAAERIDWEFRAADIDVAGHVNNAVYWQIAEQHLPAAAGGVEIEIEFRGGAVIGAATLLRQGGMLWVLDREGSVSASVSTRPLDRQASPRTRQTEEESE